MEHTREIYFEGKEALRQWLAQNHDTSEPVWLLFYKKESGKPTLTYDEAVNQALCYGWIDGTIKNIDEEKYKRKFYPRKNLTNWSPTNRKRVDDLISSGEMTAFGLAKIGFPVKNGRVQWPETSNGKKEAIPDTLPQEYLKLLKLNQIAHQAFMKLSPSQQKRYVGWIMQAKQESTRQKRLSEAIELLVNNVKNLIK